MSIVALTCLINTEPIARRYLLVLCEVEIYDLGGHFLPHRNEVHTLVSLVKPTWSIRSALNDPVRCRQGSDAS